MKTLSMLVAWVCIFSTLLMGCYVPAMIDPTGPEKDGIDPKHVTRVLLKNGRIHEFDTPPVVTDSAIVYPAWKTMVIPLTDVAHFYSPGTSDKVYFDNLDHVVLKDGALIQFSRPPRVSEGKIVAVVPIGDVSIPLAEVHSVNGKKFDVVLSVIGGGVLIVAGIGLAALLLDGLFGHMRLGRM